MTTFEQIFQAIKADEQNKTFTAQGIDPLYFVHENARICLIGQAPGRIAQEKHQYWDDPSGDRLRAWMGIDRETRFITLTELQLSPWISTFQERENQATYLKKGICAKMASNVI